MRCFCSFIVFAFLVSSVYFNIHVVWSCVSCSQCHVRIIASSVKGVSKHFLTKSLIHTLEPVPLMERCLLSGNLTTDWQKLDLISDLQAAAWSSLSWSSCWNVNLGHGRQQIPQSGTFQVSQCVLDKGKGHQIPHGELVLPDFTQTQSWMRLTLWIKHSLKRFLHLNPLPVLLLKYVL